MPWLMRLTFHTEYSLSFHDYGCFVAAKEVRVPPEATMSICSI